MPRSPSFPRILKTGRTRIPILTLSAEADYLPGKPGTFIQTDDGQVVRRLSIEVLSGGVNRSKGNDRARSLELVLLHMGPPSAVGTDVSWREVVLTAGGALGSYQAVPLRYAPPEPGSLSCGHLTSTLCGRWLFRLSLPRCGPARYSASSTWRFPASPRSWRAIS